MMSPKVKSKWVKALRSGNYKQTREVLKANDCFCCLGVLCELSQLETGFGITQNYKETYGDEHLGKTVMDWSGLVSLYGNRVSINGYEASLAKHNDGGRSFAQIADAIEGQL